MQAIRALKIDKKFILTMTENGEAVEGGKGHGDKVKIKSQDNDFCSCFYSGDKKKIVYFFMGQKRPEVINDGSTDKSFSCMVEQEMPYLRRWYAKSYQDLDSTWLGESIKITGAKITQRLQA